MTHAMLTERPWARRRNGSV